jgi:hypothetical protein
MLAVGTLATLAIASCATTHLDASVFHSKKGYRVALPGGDWIVANGDDADLTLKHRDGQRGIVVHAACDAARARGPLNVLARHLLSGLRERSVITRADVSLNGKVARHAVVEGRVGDAREPMTVEVYVTRDDRCVYDFIYAAPPDAFEAGRADFERLVNGFATE